ncbi:MAG TPA: ABC transporter permease [Candidatus Saccharimonadales bacterium]|jgi:ABC-2 type transport system permease protein|nr:ABC transporter permease [Candidatus Saccharimonadales bacterium]
MEAIYILWLRQMKRWMRARSRIVAAIGQPLLFLLALGYGLGSAFKQSGHGSYLHFLVPGIMAQSVLFSAVFFGVNIINDKQFGFLKETLVTPVSRAKIMLGGALGGATTSVFQGALVLIISLFLGFRPYNWLMVIVSLLILAVLAVALASFSSGIGSIVNDVQGFQAINQFLVFPLFFLSGSLYPLTNAPRALKDIANFNPISYAVDALRESLLHQTHFGYTRDFIALGITVVVLVLFGIYRFQKIEA